MSKRNHNFLDRTGEKHVTKEGCPFIITEYFNAKNSTIVFDNGFIKHTVNYASIVRGLIKNPYHKSVCGIGHIGIGKYSFTKCKYIYSRWMSMLRRCSASDYKKMFPTYKDVTVCEEWKCLQNFGTWFEENYIEGFELDKDILFKGNKIYSPETCSFVPQEVNLLFIKSDKTRGELPIGVYKHGKKYSSHVKANGVLVDLGTFNTPEEAFQAYKITKEVWIKEVANKWRGQITEQCYWALMNYKVEITD